jgi:hypothetical protein
VGSVFRRLQARLNDGSYSPSTRKSPSAFIMSCVRMLSIIASSVITPELATKYPLAQSKPRLSGSARNQTRLSAMDCWGPDRGKTGEGIGNASPRLVQYGCTVIRSHLEVLQRVSNVRRRSPQCFATRFES